MRTHARYNDIGEGAGAHIYGYVGIKENPRNFRSTGVLGGRGVIGRGGGVSFNYGQIFGVYGDVTGRTARSTPLHASPFPSVCDKPMSAPSP